MIRRYMPVDNRNPKREWPCRALSGEMVMVKCGTVTHTTEDLTSWVKSGLLCEFPPVTNAPAQSIAPAPAPAPAPIRTTSDAVANAFSNALSGVFPKAAPSPVVEAAPPAPAPVVEPVAAPEPVEEDIAEDTVDASADAPADATDYNALKRAALWALVVERGLDTGREYRSLTKGDLIYILSGGSDVA